MQKDYVCILKVEWNFLPFSLMRAVVQSISLSNHVMGITPVVMTVSFMPVSAAAFKLISITGLRFAALNAITASVLCSNLSPSQATMSAAFMSSSGLLLLNASTAVAPVSSAAAVVCQVAGFTNIFAANSSSASAALSLFDGLGSPLFTQSRVIFPEILTPRFQSFPWFKTFGRSSDGQGQFRLMQERCREINYSEFFPFENLLR